ncbi:MAG: HD domain-containing protein, partial [Defluviitaleaceae bacterium]|nr:HD domain-containing protein [Defluviitaleaceae bacterium]
GEFISYGNMDEQPVIPALANVAANTLSNLFHIQEIRKVFNSFVSAMVRTIDERSKYNSNHTHKVAALCDLFGKHLGKIYPEGHPFHFGERRLEELTMAAMLHDIGKIVTPIHIMDKADRLGERLPIVQNKFIMNELVLENNMLKEQISKEDYNAQKTRLDAAFALVGKVNALGFLPDDLAEQVLALADLAFVDKNGETVRLLDDGDIASLSVRKGTLTDAERLIMQEHANTTGRILSNIAFKKYYKNVTAWAQSHHEFLDGTGYPQGLAGDELATEVLIITIMDIFEALTAGDRPYKKAMPPERAFGILNEMAEEGKLHADLVRLFQDSGIWMQL